MCVCELLIWNLMYIVSTFNLEFENYLSCNVLLIIIFKKKYNSKVFCQNCSAHLLKHLALPQKIGSMGQTAL